MSSKIDETRCMGLLPVLVLLAIFLGGCSTLKPYWASEDTVASIFPEHSKVLPKQGLYMEYVNRNTVPFPDVFISHHTDLPMVEYPGSVHIWFERIDDSGVIYGRRRCKSSSYTDCYRDFGTNLEVPTLRVMAAIDGNDLYVAYADQDSHYGRVGIERYQIVGRELRLMGDYRICGEDRISLEGKFWKTKLPVSKMTPAGFVLSIATVGMFWLYTSEEQLGCVEIGKGYYTYTRTYDFEPHDAIFEAKGDKMLLGKDVATVGAKKNGSTKDETYSGAGSMADHKSGSTKERLLQLKELYDDGLIDEQGYKRKRGEILDSF